MLTIILPRVPSVLSLYLYGSTEDSHFPAIQSMQGEDRGPKAIKI